MKKGKINIVMGGQCGSEAKGKIGAYLVDKFNIINICGNLSPNAGHTVIKGGVKTVTHHIPVSAVGTKYPEKTQIFLGPATIINPSTFGDEVKKVCENTGIAASDIIVDKTATIIMPGHIVEESKTMTVIGSTAQGVGKARASRIMRNQKMVGDFKSWIGESGVTIQSDVGAKIREMLKKGATFLYEMSQGFDLCMYHGVDPVYCTSRICNPMAALAEMGVPSKYLGDVYAVIRPYPIRVNNRDGSSGPYPSEEITWEEVAKRSGNGDITELTTTTKLSRRVFEFAWDQIKRMVSICDPNYLCLNFANYIDAENRGKKLLSHTTDKTVDFIFDELEGKTNIPVAYVGTGPEHDEIIDMKCDGWG